MKTYFCREDYMVGICSDGTEFIFDKEDFEKVKEWNWMHHNNDIDGAKGKARKSLSKVVLGLEEYNLPILKRVKNFDFRKSNLYYENSIVDNGEYLEIETISGDIIFTDKEDYGLVRKYRWYINNAGYPEAKLGKKIFRLHRMILGLDGEFSYDEVVDHINRNTLDNRKCNLRIVPQGDNARNRGVSSSNKSGVTGVHWNKEMKAWIATRSIKGKNTILALIIKSKKPQMPLRSLKNVWLVEKNIYQSQLMSSA